MRPNNALNVIQARMDAPELLACLAEEATELAHAALKLRRTYNSYNPTPVPAETAYIDLLEELADVQNCIEALGINRAIDRIRIRGTAEDKMERWARRLVEEDIRK